MSRIIVSFLWIAILFAVIGAWMQGGGGVLTTNMTAPVGTANTTFFVSDTGNFLANDVLIIDNEHVRYNGKTATSFTGITRAIDYTTATTHSTGAMVYTEAPGVVNQALGFDAASIAASNGAYAAIMIPWKFLTVTLPYIMYYSFPMFEGDLSLARYMFMAAGISLYILIAIAIGQVVAYALRR